MNLSGPQNAKVAKILPLLPIFFFVLLDRSLILPRSLECSGGISWLIATSASGVLWVSSNSPASASWVAGTTGTHHHAQLISVFLVEIEFHHIGRAGLYFVFLVETDSCHVDQAGLYFVFYKYVLVKVKNKHSGFDVTLLGYLFWGLEILVFFLFSFQITMQYRKWLQYPALPFKDDEHWRTQDWC